MTEKHKAWLDFTALMTNRKLTNVAEDDPRLKKLNVWKNLITVTEGVEFDPGFVEDASSYLAVASSASQLRFPNIPEELHRLQSKMIHSLYSTGKGEEIVKAIVEYGIAMRAWTK